MASEFELLVISANTIVSESEMCVIPEITMASESKCDFSESDKESYDSTASDELLVPSNLMMPLVTDAVFAHFSRNLFVRELVQLRRVCKQFRDMVPQNSVFTALNRRQDDDSKDWYIPVQFEKHMVREQPTLAPDGLKKRKRGRSSWQWSGTHHPTGEFHTLPSLEHLPSGKIEFRDYPGFRCLMSSSGALLLFVLKTGTNQWNARFRICPGEPSSWIPLLVSNPLTQEYRVLPKPATAKSTWWDYRGAQLHVVEDECARAYTIVLLCRDRILAYKSTTNCSSSFTFQVPMPQDFPGNANVYFTDKYYNVPYAIVGGKLFYGALEVDGNTMPIHRDNIEEILSKSGVQVFEVDYIGGTWKHPVRLALQHFVPNDLHDRVLDFGFEVGSFGIDMVSCKGGLYVLIPASFNITLEVNEKVRKILDDSRGDGALNSPRCYSSETYEQCGILSLRFYVLKVKGDGLPFGQALIQPPIDGFSKGTKYWLSKFDIIDRPSYLAKRKWWYRARGWGSAIHIMVGNCIIRYDVMSGTTRTRVVKDPLKLVDQPDVAYRPSLYMKP